MDPTWVIWEGVYNAEACRLTRLAPTLVGPGDAPEVVAEAVVKCSLVPLGRRIDSRPCSMTIQSGDIDFGRPLVEEKPQWFAQVVATGFVAVATT